MRTNRLTLFVVLMVLIGLVLQFRSSKDSLTDKLLLGIDVMAKLATAGGLIGLVYQVKRDKDLTEANFVVLLNQNFITNENISRIYNLLEESKNDKQKDENLFKFPDDIIDMANYLSFFGPFWGLIERGVVHISTIDILAYRFFLATNNRFMQDELLCRSEKVEAWRNIYLLHKVWQAYRYQNNLHVWQEKSDLSKKDPTYSNITKECQPTNYI